MKSILDFRHNIEKYGFKCLEFGNPHPWVWEWGGEAGRGWNGKVPGKFPEAESKKTRRWELSVCAAQNYE
jgi:hypothetical protein